MTKTQAALLLQAATQILLVILQHGHCTGSHIDLFSIIQTITYINSELASTTNSGYVASLKNRLAIKRTEEETILSEI